MLATLQNDSDNPCCTSRIFTFALKREGWNPAIKRVAVLSLHAKCTPAQDQQNVPDDSYGIRTVKT